MMSSDPVLPVYKGFDISSLVCLILYDEYRSYHSTPPKNEQADKLSLTNG